MAVTIAGRILADNADAPASLAEWTSDSIALRRESQHGPLALASVLDFYIFCEGRNFTWWIDGSEDGATWFVMATAAELAHVAGGLGKKGTERIPASLVRMRVRNDGAGAITNFRVIGSCSVL